MTSSASLPREGLAALVPAIDEAAAGGDQVAVQLTVKYR
jgi:hypothetical protein